MKTIYSINRKIISVSSQLCPLFADWSFIYQTAIKSSNINYSGNDDNTIYDFSLLLSFESFKVFKYWYPTVKFKINKKNNSQSGNGQCNMIGMCFCIIV